MKRLVLSKENKKDLRDLPKFVQEEIEFIFVEKVDEVLDAAIGNPSSRLKWVG